MKTDLDDLIKKIKKFRHDRNWEQFHDPKNLAEAIVIEASELLENFLWLDKNESRKISSKKLKNIGQEIADIFMFLLYLCQEYEIDIISEAKKKLKINSRKYPICKARGIAKKYTEL